MAPTTRAATNKASNPPLDAESTAARKRPRKKVKKTKKAEEAKHAPVETPNTRCQLLELPPEIRNRIYHFCNDNRYIGTLRKTETGKEKPEHMRTNAFIALAQVCKQIRFEYLPLWLRQLRVRIDFSDLEEFLTAFYRVSDRHEDWYRDAPTILNISWDHDRMEHADFHTFIPIESLLKLHAYSPASTVMFECRRLAEFDLPCTDCWECRLCINCKGPDSGHSDFSFDSEEFDNFCEHEGAIDEIVDVLAVEYEYLDALNAFLNNDNATWLKHVQGMCTDYVTMGCTMGEDCAQATIYIRFARSEVPKHLRTRNTHRGAFAYRTEMGMTHLEGCPELRYVVGVQTYKYLRSIDGQLERVYDQALIRDLKAKAKSSSAQAGKQIPEPAVQG